MTDELSQKEIDALLSGIGSVEAEQMEEIPVVSIPKAKKGKPVKLYDFRRPDKLSKDQLRTLNIIHQNLAGAMASGLSANVRTSVQSSLMLLEQKLFKEYLEQIEEPTSLTIVALDPLPGRIIIELGLDIGYLLVDRLLGGPGKQMPRNRTVTEIEISLLKTVVNSLLFALTETWSGVVDLKPRVEDTTLNPQFVQIALPTDVVIFVAFEIRLLGVAGTLTICLPHSVLEPIIPQLTAEVWLSQKQRGSDEMHMDHLAAQLGLTQLPLRVRLGETKLSVSELLGLQLGDVVALDSLADNPLDVLVDSRPKFKARPGIQGSRVAIQIVEVLDEELNEA